MSTHTTISVSKGFHETLQEQTPRGVSYEAYLRQYLPDDFSED